MDIIRKANPARIGALGNQKISQEKKYRPLIYTTFIEVNEGFLLYNNLTDELLFLKREEKEILNNFNLSDQLCKTLAYKWYYVPQEQEDYKLADQLENLMKLLLDTRKDSAITTYTIFSTTDCNARCFYCYENGIKKIHMSEKVATDTANYIINHSQGKPVKIRWFGGEPLYNSKAIDIISEKLKEANVDFRSSMVSNGYLIDDEIVEKALKLWNLQQVQITLDGTAEKYNKIKAFIHPDNNPFERVITNIEKLLKANIFVSIRMNMDKHNYENLYELVKFLCNKFNNYRNLSMYSQTLFDESSQMHMDRTEAERDIAFINNIRLNDYIKQYNYSKGYTLNNYLKNAQCMADKDHAITINPEGALGKCEHYAEEYLWGSIYSDDINMENIKRFKKRVPLIGKCHTCPVRPGCLQLEECPDARRCNLTLQNAHFANLKNRIINTYNLWKQEQ